MTTTQEERLKRLKEKREKMLASLNARIQMEESKLKNSERKKETRQKILIGAYYLEQAQKEPSKMDEIKKIMGSYLKRNSDRVLFGLPLLKEKS